MNSRWRWRDESSRARTDRRRQDRDRPSAAPTKRRADKGRRSLHRIVAGERASGWYLRNRSPAIKITKQDVSPFTDRWEIVYSYRRAQLGGSLSMSTVVS